MAYIVTNRRYIMQWIKSNAGVFTLGIFVMANITYMESRIGGIESRIGGIESRMENRMEDMENRIGGIESRMEDMENRLNNKIETEISKVEVEIKELRNLIITLIAENKTNKASANGRVPASRHKPTGYKPKPKSS